MTRVLYVSGGSAGHLAPLVAVERAVKSMEKESEHFFLCSEKPEDAAYLRHEHVTFKQVPLIKRSLSIIGSLVKNYRISKEAIAAFKPDVIFTKGGSVSIPTCYIAHKMNIPIVLHESDAVMGRANAFISKWARTVCVGFPNVSDKWEVRSKKPSHLSHTTYHFAVTGNPIRPEITEGNREEGLKLTDLTGERPIILVWGGSQGAEALNDAVRSNINELLSMCDIVHLTGKGKKGVEPREGYWSTEFAYAELPHLFAIATMALSRSGAGTISELAALKIPAILVPIRGLANDHQFWNATTAQDNGGCILLLQEHLKTELVSTVQKLVSNPDERTRISQSMRKLHQPDAARLVAENILECVASRRPSH